MRLLLVEDERKLSQVLAKGLKKLSYTVDQAFDGEEALELFSVYGYDMSGGGSFHVSGEGHADF